MSTEGRVSKMDDNTEDTYNVTTKYKQINVPYNKNNYCYINIYVTICVKIIMNSMDKRHNFHGYTNLEVYDRPQIKCCITNSIMVKI